MFPLLGSMPHKIPTDIAPGVGHEITSNSHMRHTRTGAVNFRRRRINQWLKGVL